MTGKTYHCFSNFHSKMLRKMVRYIKYIFAVWILIIWLLKGFSDNVSYIKPSNSDECIWKYIPIFFTIKKLSEVFFTSQINLTKMFLWLFHNHDLLVVIGKCFVVLSLQVIIVWKSMYSINSLKIVFCYNNWMVALKNILFYFLD